MDSIASRAIRNVVALAAAWVVSFAVVQLITRMPHSVAAIDAAMLVVSVVALFVAARVRAVIAAWILGAFAACMAAEFAAHAIFGPHAAQGAGSHWGILIAAFGGVAIGAVMQHSRPVVAS